MTVNERLYHAGLLDQFDKAALKKDRNEMIDLLMTVELVKSQAEETANAILENPAFYGY